MNGDLTLESAIHPFDTPCHYCADTAEAFRLIPGTSVVALHGPARARFYVAHTSPVRCLATTQAAGVAATAAGVGASWELYVWKPTTLTQIVALSPPTEGNAGALAALSFSHDGERLIGVQHGASPRALLWRWRSDSTAAEVVCPHLSMPGPTAWALCLPDAPSGHVQLLTANAQMLRFWVASSEGEGSLHPADASPAADAQGATCVLEVPTPPVEGAANGGRGGGGALVVSAHSSGGLRAWRLWQGAGQAATADQVGLVRSVSGHQGAALALASCGAERAQVASGGADGLVRLWTAYLDPVRTINLAHCWAANPMLTRITCQPNSHEASHTVPPYHSVAPQAADVPGGPPSILSVCAANAGTLLVGTGDLLALHMDTGRCELVASGGHSEPWEDADGDDDDAISLLIAASPCAVPADTGGMGFATAGADRTLRVWRCDHGGGEPCALVHSSRLAATPSALAYATRGAHLAVADTRGVLQLFKRERLTPAAGRAALPSGTYATCLAFDALDTRLASGSSDGALTVWRLPELQLIHTIDAHPSRPLLSIDWSTAGHANAGVAVLTSAAPPGRPMEARVWRAADGALLADVTDEEPIGGIDAAPLLPTGRGPPARLVDGALLSWPWLSYTCPVGWSVAPPGGLGHGSKTRVAAARRLAGQRLGGDMLAALSQDGSLHLSPFACAGTLDSSTRLSTPNERLATAGGRSGGYAPTSLQQSPRRRRTSALAISADGTLLITASPSVTSSSSGAVLVWRLHRPSPPVRPSIGVLTGRVPDPTEIQPRPPEAMSMHHHHATTRLPPSLSHIAAVASRSPRMPPASVGGSGGDVACALGRAVYVSPWRGGGCTRLYTGHSGAVSAMAVHPSGGVVASGESGSLRIWSLASLQTLAVLGSGSTAGAARGGASYAPTHLAFSPDGHSLLSLVPHPTPEDAAAADADADSRTASAIVEALDAMNDKLSATESTAAADAHGTDGAGAQSMGWTTALDDKGVTYYSNEAGESTYDKPALGFDDDDEYVDAAVEADTSIEAAAAAASNLLCDPKDEDEDALPPTRPGVKRAPRPHADDVTDGPTSPSSAILAVWAWAGGAGARSLPSGIVHVARPTAQARAHDQLALCACWVTVNGARTVNGEEAAMQGRGDGGSMRLASGGVGHVRFWRLEDRKLLVEAEPHDVGMSTTVGGGGVYLCCCATPAAVFFGSSDGSLLHFAPTTGSLLQRIPAHRGPLTALAPLGPLDVDRSATRAVVASGGVDGRIRLWTSSAAPCAEWRVSKPVNALRDTRGRPLDACGGLGDAELRGLSWAGPRGAVAQTGRATFSINAASGAAELCLLPVPTASGRDSVAYDVWRTLPLPACELVARPEARDAPRLPAAAPAPPMRSTAVAAAPAMVAVATTQVPRRAGASSDGWGRDDDDAVVATTQMESRDEGAQGEQLPAPQVPASAPMTVRVGGWRSDVPSVNVVAGGGRVYHEALTRWR